MTQNLIRELQHERSELLDRLMQARSHIVGLRGLLDYAQSSAKEGKLFHSGETVCEVIADADAFLATGLFGDKAPQDDDLSGMETPQTYEEFSRSCDRLDGKL